MGKGTGTCNHRPAMSVASSFLDDADYRQEVEERQAAARKVFQDAATRRKVKEATQPSPEGSQERDDNWAYTDAKGGRFQYSNNSIQVNELEIDLGLLQRLVKKADSYKLVPFTARDLKSGASLQWGGRYNPPGYEVHIRASWVDPGVWLPDGSKTQICRILGMDEDRWASGIRVK